MSSLRELVGSIKSGSDTTNPYSGLKKGLNSLTSKASGIVFTDPSAPSSPPSAVTVAIDAFDAFVLTFNASINGVIVDMDSHYTSWWTGINGYKTIPSVLNSADSQENRMLESDGLPPKEEQLTFFYLGSQTWSEAAGNLSGWLTSIEDAIATIDTIVGGPQLDTVEITDATNKLTDISSDMSSLISNFNSLASVETTAWDDAIKFFNAYAYATFIENNRSENPLVEDLVNKFSGNLDSIVDRLGGGMASAYSLRNISSAWSDQNVIEVRSGVSSRGFTSEEILNGTLKDWCSSAPAYVTTWYDQSGKGNDASQTVEVSQPKIHIGGLEYPRYMRHHAGFLYWGDGTEGIIYRVKLDVNGDASESPVALITDQGIGLKGLHVNDDYIYCLNSASDKLTRFNLDGSGATDLVTDTIVTPNGISANDTHLFITDDGSDGIYRCDLDGQNLTQIYQQAGGYRDCWATNTFLYWLDQGTDVIRRSNLDGSNVVTLANVPGNMFGISLTSDYIYVAAYSDPGLYRIDIADGGNMQSLSSVNSQGCAVTDDYVYYVNINVAAGERGINKYKLESDEYAEGAPERNQSIIPGLISNNGLPAIEFDGEDDEFDLSSDIVKATDIAAILQTRDEAKWNNVVTETFRGFRTTNTNLWQPATAGGNSFQSQGQTYINGEEFTTNQDASLNSVLLFSANDGGYPYDLKHIGGGFESRNLAGKVQELIIFDETQAGNEITIQDFINLYYKVY